MRFDFVFSPAYRIAGAPFGVTPRSTAVEVDDQDLRVRFGPWRIASPLANIAGCERSGPFQFVKTAGPAHLSFADQGLTCATNGESGLCVRFVEPVTGMDPLGLIKSPGLTVTVGRLEELEELLTRS